MVYFRADGNGQIGTGHIMRCLSIAYAVRSMGGESAVFITADFEMSEIIKRHGFQVICLESVWNNLDNETEKLVCLMKEHENAVLFIDSYFVTADYLTRLCAVAKICYMDDLDAMKYPCHMLINYNIYAQSLFYEERYPMLQLLLGTQFVPLRNEFQNLSSISVRKIVRNVFITTGGSDNYRISESLLTQISKKNDNNIKFHVVVGRYYHNLDTLKILEQEHSNFSIHTNVENMAELMRRCDIAVSAGGSTLYELCACGIPTIVLTLADNQLQIAKTFSDQNIMLYAGDIREDENCILNIINLIGILKKDYCKREILSKHMKMFVDGNGAYKIAEALKSFSTFV